MTIVTIYVDNADRLSEVRFWGNTEALFCVIEYRGINCEWDDRSWLIDNRSWKKKPIEGDRYYRRLRNTRCNLMISTSHRAAITSFAQSKQEISLIMLLGRLQGWRLRNLRRLPGTSPRHVTFHREEKSREREIQCAIVSDIMRKMRDNREFELLCETRHVIVGKIFLQFDIGLTSIN